MIRHFNFYLEKMLEISTLLFIVSIIIVPKFPLISTNYSVPIRFDDFFIIPPLLFATAMVVRSKEFLRIFNSRLSKIIFIWLSIMLISIIIGKFTGSIPKFSTAFLFWLRYVQYAAALFIGVTVLRNSKDVKKYSLTLLFIIFPIGIYAIAQRFGWIGGFGGGFYNYIWVKNTDRSFATFAGPYELAAYMVLVIPILIMVSQNLYSLKNKIGWIVLYCLSVIALAFAAARTPLFAVFVGSISTVIFINNWKRRLTIALLSLIVLIVPFFFSSTLVTRANDFLLTLGSIKTNLTYKAPASIPVYEPKIDIATTTPQPNSSSNTPPVINSGQKPIIINPITPKSSNPAPLVITSKTSASTSNTAASSSINLTPTTTQAVSSQASSQEPAPAANIEPSLKWRFDNLWPMAFSQFKKDPLFGGGLGSSGISADSTYVTLLGETGLLGVIIFLVLIYEIFKIIIKNIATSTGLNRLLFIGLFGGIVALLINAIFIDVFRASKIAYVFWILVGVSLRYYLMYKRVYEEN